MSWDKYTIFLTFEMRKYLLLRFRYFDKIHVSPFPEDIQRVLGKRKTASFPPFHFPTHAACEQQKCR